MNLQEVFKKIEMALTPSEETPQEVQLATMKLANGVILEAESFEAGQNVFLIGEEDQKVAAPIGEHELEDGKILVVEEEGVIAEIREAVAEEIVEEEESTEMAEEEEMAYVTKEEFGAAIDELKEMIAGMMPKEEQSADEVSEEVQEEEKVEMSADELPAAKKVAAAPVDKKPEMVQFSKKSGANTLSRVLSKLS